MSRYVLTPQAKADLTQVLDFIRQSNGDAAVRVRAEFHNAMRKLAEMPGMGHLRTDVTGEALRFWRVYSYLVVYRPETRPLQIIRVLHGARDIMTILEDE